VEAEHKECTETVVRLEEQLTDLGDVDNLHQERRTIQDKIKANKEDLLRFQVRSCFVPMISIIYASHSRI
jgi:hypothetical protein